MNKDAITALMAIEPDPAKREGRVYSHRSPAHLQMTVASLEGLTYTPLLDEMAHEMAQNIEIEHETDKYSSQALDITTLRP